MITDLQIAEKLVNLNMSAKDRKIFFNLSFKTTKRLLTTKRCYYTGDLFTEQGPNRRTFDRVDNNKGYTDSNVVACTLRINSLKANLTVKDILSITKGLKKKLK